MLLVIFYIDLDHQIIPNRLTYPGVVLGLATSFWNPKMTGLLGFRFLESFAAAFTGVFFFIFIGYFSLLVFKKEGIGGGDVKLAGMMGAFLGLKLFGIALFVSIGLGALAAMVLMGLRVRSRHDYIPFGPALVTGSLTALFWGETMWEGYLRFIGAG